MYAVEFETDITDRFIEIKDFEKVANMHARVIVLVEQPLNTANKNTNTDFIDSLLKTPIHLENNTKFLSRDEVNDRYGIC